MCMKYDVDQADQCPIDRLAKCHRRKADSACVVKGITNIKREIMKNGPVVASIPVTREFLVYGSGIYDTSSESNFLGRQQAVKVIGWGINREGIEYWIIENSWGETWGIKGRAKVKEIGRAHV